MTRRIDHLVLPVVDLGTARSRYGVLGFTVAPDADHPFGTSNSCVFLADGTYLEPLAWRDENLVRRSAQDGNQFTARDIAFRAAFGEDGMSALVVTSADAAADHEYFIADGISGGDMLEFSRQALTADGQAVTARFRLSFVDACGSDAFFLFSCERLNPLPADRTALENHVNGVLALKEIVLSSAEPTRLVSVLERLTGQSAVKEDGADLFILPNGRIRLMTDAADLPGPAHAPLAAHMLVFRVADLSVTEKLLAANQVPFEKRDARIVVSAAPGQGVAFAFEG
ncbi:VOC family protein [Rhizobium sp. FY34]|uniref:VOC family protein n=1 Tax=Rhizobium sp. FY34 TaxID=2562309 RepID=UPI0010C1397C|nr:VOC family protein [Rhizobium sp. FY34]